MEKEVGQASERASRLGQILKEGGRGGGKRASEPMSPLDPLAPSLICSLGMEGRGQASERPSELILDTF